MISGSGAGVTIADALIDNIYSIADPAFVHKQDQFRCPDSA